MGKFPRALPKVTFIAIALALSFSMCLLVCGCSANKTIESNDVSNSDIVGTSESQSTESTSQSQASSETSDSTANTTSYSGKVVVIDAGHQAKGDTSQEPIGPGASETKDKVTYGTSGRYSGVAEYVVNLQVALKLRDYLESNGVTVVMVRESNDVNISNSERAAVANSNNAALFVRLHCDGSESSSNNGFCTLVPGENEWTAPIVESSRIAGQYVQNAAIAATGANDLGIVERTDLSGFNWCEVPTVLCEMGFMSNKQEDMLLTSDDYQNKLATGIGNGVLDYLSTLG